MNSCNKWSRNREYIILVKKKDRYNLLELRESYNFVLIRNINEETKQSFVYLKKN